MKLDVSDKLMVTLACCATCLFLLEGVASFPWWKVSLFTCSCLLYLWLAIKIWMVEGVE